MSKNRVHLRRKTQTRLEQSIIKPPEHRTTYDPRTGILVEQRPSGEIRIEVDVASGIRAVELNAAQGQEVFNFLKERFK